MSLWKRWVQQPQNVLLRRVLFQIHLWTGIGCGLYVLLISVSGSALVYRRELSKAFSHEPVITAVPGGRLTPEQLQQAVELAYPQYRVIQIFTARNPTRAVAVDLERNGKKKERLFDPYTGADLGDSMSPAFRFVLWLTELHDNLLLGRVGRRVNGVGGIFTVLLCLTGAVVWWPGIKNWRRSLTVTFRTGSGRFNWSLHSALGFWLFLFVLVWGISGIYLSFPAPIDAAAEYLSPANAGTRQSSAGEMALFWLARLHFGRFAGLTVKLIWTVFGLAPAVLFVTGIVMWWNRALRKQVKRLRAKETRLYRRAVFPGRPHRQPASGRAVSRPPKETTQPGI